MIQLEIRHGDTGKTEDRRFDAADGPIIIGRDPECTIPLTAQAVSRKHATIEPAPDGWVLTDHSTLGTTLNDATMENERATLLSNGDRIGLHEAVITVTILGARSGSEHEEDYADNLMKLVSDVQQEVERAGRIEVLHAGSLAGSVPLGEEGSSLFIGRSNECEVQIDDPLRLVSGVHARVEREWAGAFLYDLSRNGIYVNGDRVVDCRPLADGDRITLALAEERPDGVVLVYLESEGSAEQPPDDTEEIVTEAPPAETVESGEPASPGGAPAAQVESPPGKTKAPSGDQSAEPPAETDDSAKSREPSPPRDGDGASEKKAPPTPAGPKPGATSGQGAFFWIVVAVAIVVVAAFAIIGIRLMGS